MSGRKTRSPGWDRRDRRQFDRPPPPPFQERDVDGRSRERRVADAEHYRNGTDRVPSTEHRDWNRENERNSSRDLSEHGSRRNVPLKQPSSTNVDPGLGRVFVSSIQTLNRLVTAKEILSLQRDKAKQDYEEAKLFYEKGKPTVAQFPSEAERAKAKCLKEKATLEDFEKKLKDLDTNITTAETAVAVQYQTLVASKVEERVSKPDFNTEERFSRLEKQYQGLLDKHRILKEEYTTLEGDMKDKLQKMGSKTAKDLASMSASLANRTEGDVSLSKSMIELKTDSSRYHDQLSQLQGQLIQVQALIDGLPNAVTNSSNDEKFQQRIQSLETKLDSTTTSNLQLAPRIEALENGQIHLSTIQEEFVGLQNNIKSFDEDLLAHNDRILSLENSSGDANRIENHALTNKSTENVAGGVRRINELEVATKGLKVDVFALNESYKAGDKLYGELMEGFQMALEKLRTTVNEIEAHVKAQKNSITTLVVQQNNITNEQQQLFKSIETLKPKRLYSGSASSPELDSWHQDTNLDFPQNSRQNGVSKPIVDASVLQNQVKEAKDLQATFQRELSDLRNFQVGTDLGLRTLDTRMNNINTEHLSRQIIGQLQSAYPHLPQAETRLKDCKNSLDFLEKAVRDHTESIRYLREGALKQTNELQSDKVYLGKLIDDVRQTTVSKQSWEGALKEGLAKCHNQVTSIKNELDGKIAISANNLQKQIANIEGIIEFDDEDGKTETVKEKVKVLTEHYGTLTGHVDVLSEQISLLKKGASSRHAASTTRAGSVGPGSSSVSGTGRLTKKRSAPNSPLNTHIHASGSPTNKRRRNELGPFVDEDDEDSRVLDESRETSEESQTHHDGIFTYGGGARK